MAEEEGLEDVPAAEAEEGGPSGPEVEQAAVKIQALARGAKTRRASKETKENGGGGGGSGPQPAAEAAAEAEGGGEAAAEVAEVAEPAAEAAEAVHQPEVNGLEQVEAALRVKAAPTRAPRKNEAEAVSAILRAESGALPLQGSIEAEVERDEAGGLAPYLEGGALGKAYLDGCRAAGRKANHLVRTSLDESMEAAQETFFIEAPGNHKLVFSSRLTDADLLVFAQVFRGPVPFLARLDLSYNQLTDKGAETLATGLLGARARRLTSLSLRSNSIGPDGCLVVCQALVHCHALTRLDFSSNPLGRDGGLIIVDLMHEAPQMSELYIQDTEADIDVLVAMATALLDGRHQLNVCNLENPRIETLQEDHTVHLGRMLRVNTYLSEIYLGKIKMRDEGVRQLVSFLLENKTLRVLDLRCNELGADGAKHLGVLLASDCQLSLLNLSSNRIGEKANVGGAAALAKSLLNNRMLRHLDLNNNSLCGDAIKALAESVDQNSTLETIGLFHNNWDQPSAYKFHQILNDRARILPLRADFVTSEVDLRIDICKIHDFAIN